MRILEVFGQIGSFLAGIATVVIAADTLRRRR